MPDLHLYDYAVVRVVPRTEREEFINAGVILSCPTLCFLGARIELHQRRLEALCPGIDIGFIRDHLASVPVICQGGAAAGAIGQLAQRERFHWLTAIRSTIIQCSAVHTGFCADPSSMLDRLVETMVRCGPR